MTIDLTDETLRASCSHACGYCDHDGLSATCIVCDAELTDLSVGEALGPRADDVALLRVHLEAAREEVVRLRALLPTVDERDAIASCVHEATYSPGVDTRAVRYIAADWLDRIEGGSNG